MAACMARDLEAFGAFISSAGGTDEVARQLDLRRRGLDAASHEEAAAAGREWAAEQARRSGGAEP